MESNEVIPFDQTRKGSWWSLVPKTPWSWKWCPTSPSLLERAEKRILSSIWDSLEHRFVTVRNGTAQLRTVVLNKESRRMPLVLLHGFGSGVGLWILNLQALALARPVYALDLLGFGRSTRIRFREDAAEVEAEYVESLEAWRRSVGLDKFILLGHSLGGYLAAAYTLQHPEHVRHLILADAWGTQEKPPESDLSKHPTWVRYVAKIIAPFNPLMGLRMAGPWGPGIVAKVRPDLIRKFAGLYEDDTVASYVYHCNAQPPSGETAFKALSETLGWAKHPMGPRAQHIDNKVPITLLYGSRSWIDSNPGFLLQKQRKDSYVDIQFITGAGHHVYADRPDLFNTLVNRVGLIVDKQIDLVGKTPDVVNRRIRRLSESGSSASLSRLGSGVGLAGSSRPRRVASEVTMTELIHREELHSAALGTSYSTSTFEEERVEHKGAESSRSSSRQRPADLIAEEEEDEDTHAKFSLGGDSDDEGAEPQG